jgi:hypothetical protein
MLWQDETKYAQWGRISPPHKSISVGENALEEVADFDTYG